MKLSAALFGLCLLAAATAAHAQPALDAARCAALTGMRIPAGWIGLPTTGAQVSAAELKPASGSGPEAVPAHCLVSGKIGPVDPAAPHIEFQLALPAAWNGKAVMFGGGGSNGVIPRITANPLNAEGAVTPLGRGYATFGSDGGHQGPGVAFALNREAHLNWMNDALKKTRDASWAVIKAAYGREPSRAYFLGSSTGGREALAVAGRWPTDWDGVVSLYPARDVTVSILGMLATSQALAAKGAYPNPAKRRTLFRAALQACDGRDGLRDGVISDIRGCRAAFRPETATVDGAPLRCPGGADTGDTCLSDAQLTALRKIDTPVRFGFPLANGENEFPGFNVFTSDTGGPGASENEVRTRRNAFGDAAPAAPPAPGMPASMYSAWDFIRYIVVGDAAYNALAFDIADPGPYAARLYELSAIDMADRDLRGFAARGGKVLLLHGTEDLLTSPRITETYYAQVKAALGEEKLGATLRYYEVPGFGHAQSAVFKMAWDQLTALEDWVEKGIDPADNQVVVDLAGAPGRTRPLCLYPAWPKYRGVGDPDKASSFTCATK